MKSTVIHIGFPKTGSTLLQSYFDMHPTIHHNRNRFQSYVKTGVITDELIEELKSDEAVDVLSEELLSIWSGDTSDVTFQTYNMNYDFESHQKQTAENLKNLFPSARVLIVTRGHESLCASLYSQYVLSGGTDKIEIFRKENEDMILKLYDYNRVIELYESTFSKEQLIVLPFESLQENPEAFLCAFEEELNVVHINFRAEIVHKSIPKNLISLIRMFTRIYKKYLVLFSKKKSQRKFERYLEKVYHFKNSSFAKLFNGKNKDIKVSDSFRNQFSLNSSRLDNLPGFNSYISKYRI
jgi:hypothetical protein